MDEDIIKNKLVKEGFRLIAFYEPDENDLEPDNDWNYPIEYASYVYKRDNKIIVMEIGRCLHSSYKSNMSISKWVQER